MALSCQTAVRAVVYLGWLKKSAVSTPLKLLRLSVYWTNNLVTASNLG